VNAAHVPLTHGETAAAASTGVRRGVPTGHAAIMNRAIEIVTVIATGIANLETGHPSVDRIRLPCVARSRG
jgi:phosphoenolpyruvate-protein kinase (PTS system EI component)